MLTYLKSFLFLCLFCFLVLLHFILLIFDKFLNSSEKGESRENRTHRRGIKWARALFTLTPGWQLRVLGKDLLPAKNTPYLIVANHESATDILALYYLKIQFRWLAKKEIFKFPLLGTAMKWAGYIPIKRGDKQSHAEAIEMCKKTVKKNTPVLFFPEGTRSTLGHPKEFKVGAFKVAKELGVPVLPVVLKGAGKLLKKGSLAPNKAIMTVKVLDLTKSAEEESVAEFTNRVENLIRNEHAKIT